jgi:uncharacterized protein (TIGR00296 family)
MASLLETLRGKRNAILRYCFWSLNRRLAPDKPIYPEPKIGIGAEVMVDGLFVSWYYMGKLRGCIGTTSPIKLVLGLRDYSVYSATIDARFEKIKREEINANLRCEVSILHSFVDITGYPRNWVIGRHGIKLSLGAGGGGAKTGVYLPKVAEQMNWSKEEAIKNLLRKAKISRYDALVKFQALTFSGNLNEKLNPSVQTNASLYFSVLQNLLLNYLGEREYKSYIGVKKRILAEQEKFVCSLKVINVLKAEFFNVHWTLLQFDPATGPKATTTTTTKGEGVWVLKDCKKLGFVSKEHEMDYVSGKIIVRGSALDILKEACGGCWVGRKERRIVKSPGTWFLWGGAGPRRVVDSYFFGLDNQDVSVVKYVELPVGSMPNLSVTFKEMTIEKKDFRTRTPPEGLALPFTFFCLSVRDPRSDEPKATFIYPDNPLSEDLDFLIESVVFEFGVEQLQSFERRTHYKKVYVPLFTSEFADLKQSKDSVEWRLMTVNNVGCFDYEGGIHEVHGGEDDDDDDYTVVRVGVDISEKNKGWLILNKPFLCFIGGMKMTTVVINPRNPFRSAKQRRYMWTRHPKIARRWTKKYGSKIRKKKKKKRK